MNHMKITIVVTYLLKKAEISHASAIQCMNGWHFLKPPDYYCQ